jgi:REP element-mobilizing transposase RayT
MKYEDEKYYHVFNRGANKETVFFSDGDYEYCISLIEKYSKKYKVQLAAYCLMFNHYHFLLRQKPGGSIHRFLQTTFNAYSQAINKELGRSGTFFQGRPKSKEIENEDYLAEICRYIHMNPVAAGLVDNPINWKFSDCAEWLRNPSDSTPTFSSLLLTDSAAYREFLFEGARQREQMPFFAYDKE